MVTFKHRINQLWEEAKDKNYKISQDQFAKQIGATKNQLKGWLRGSGEPDTELIKCVAKACNVSVDWLIGNSNIRTSIISSPGECTYDEKIKNLLFEMQRTLDVIIDLYNQKKG